MNSLPHFPQVLGLFAAVALVAAPSLAGTPSHSVGDPKQLPDGERLWAQTCANCHQAHPVTTYSDTQWQIVMQHMRTRAYLTGAEARTVLAYLQGAN